MSSGQARLSAVNALVVTRAGADIEELLTALSKQSRLPDAVTVIVTGDLPPEELSELSARLQNLFGTRAWTVQVPESSNFGEAVRSALTSDSLRTEPAWYWLLHDDVKPHVDALHHLLAAANQGAAIDAVGPKQVAWAEPGVLLELGIEATGSGRRVPLGVAQEIDQGQYDDRTDVLAVGTAGMLVRAKTWKELRGLDPHLGPYGDGLEFGRRLRRYGRRVVVAPKAILEHRQRTLNTQSPAKSFQQRRAAQLYNWLLAVPPVVPALLLLLLILWTPVRAAGRLLQRQPALALAELGALAALIAALPALVRGRRRTARAARVPRRMLRPLQFTPAQLEARRRHARRVRRSRPKPVDSIDTASRRALVDRKRANRTALRVVVIVALLASIYFWYPLTGGVAGADWAELPGKYSDLWKQAWSTWVHGGVGAPGPVNPVLPLFAVLAAPFAPLGILPTQVMFTVLAGALVFAALEGWLVARIFTHQTFWRVGAALLWAFQPGLLVAVGTANISQVLIWLGLPLTLVGLWRATRAARPLRVEGIEDFTVQRRYDPITWGAIAGLGTVIAAAGSPGTVLGVLPFAYLLALLPDADGQKLPGTPLGSVEQRPGRTGRPPASRRLIAATLAWLPAAILVLPSLIWMGQEISSDRGYRDWLFQVGSTGELPGYAWVGAALLLLAAAVSLVVSIWQRSGNPWVSRLAALGAAALLWVQDYSLGGIFAETASVALLLLVAALASLPPTTLFVGQEKPKRVVLIPTVALAAGVATFIGVLVLGPLEPGRASALQTGPETETPLVAKEAANSELAGRTLLLDQNEAGEVGAQLLREGARSQADFSAGLIEARPPAVQIARQSLAGAAGNLAAKPNDAVAKSFAAHNVALVILTAESPTGEGTLHAHLDGAAGFERIGTVDRGTMWRVRPEGQVPAELTLWQEGQPPEPVTGRKFATSRPSVLVLAEPADENWQAVAGASKLEPVPDPDEQQGWRQAFAVPAGTRGEVSVSYRPAWAPWWVGATWLSLAAAAVSSLPWRIRRPVWLLDGAQKEDRHES